MGQEFALINSKPQKLRKTKTIQQFHSSFSTTKSTFCHSEKAKVSYFVFERLSTTKSEALIYTFMERLYSF